MSNTTSNAKASPALAQQVDGIPDIRELGPPPTISGALDAAACLLILSLLAVTIYESVISSSTELAPPASLSDADLSSAFTPYLEAHFRVSNHITKLPSSTSFQRSY